MIDNLLSFGFYLVCVIVGFLVVGYVCVVLAKSIGYGMEMGRQAARKKADQDKK